jgi:hypothetical protein
VAAALPVLAAAGAPLLVHAELAGGAAPQARRAHLAVCRDASRQRMPAALSMRRLRRAARARPSSAQPFPQMPLSSWAPVEPSER